jgi:hypothetical protein
VDYDFILSEIPLQLKPEIPPPSGVQRFGHDFKHDNLVVHRLASAGRRSLSGRAGAVIPPNRSVRCCRTAAYFSGANGRPLSTRCMKTCCFKTEAFRT